MPQKNETLIFQVLQSVRVKMFFSTETAKELSTSKTVFPLLLMKLREDSCNLTSSGLSKL